MVTALESKAELNLLADDAVDTARWMLKRTTGRWESRRVQLLDTVPDVVAYYSEGAAALAADFYDESRADARASGRFVAEPVVLDRTVKIRRGIAWAAFPLSTDDDASAIARLEKLMQSEVVRPYRDTTLAARRSDPQAVGWQRITSGAACGFCRMLAAKGAVFREATATFAAHDDCRCTAAAVFKGGAVGPEASVMQYMASKRRRTPAEKKKLREYIAEYFPD